MIFNQTVGKPVLKHQKPKRGGDAADESDHRIHQSGISRKLNFNAKTADYRKQCQKGISISIISKSQNRNESCQRQPPKPKVFFGLRILYQQYKQQHCIKRNVESKIQLIGVK